MKSAFAATMQQLWGEAASASPMEIDVAARRLALHVFTDKYEDLVEVVCDATVWVACQRCLEPLEIQLQTSNLLAVVWNDEQARHLPKHLDPLILTEEACMLWELVEDELMLGLPPYNYHEQANCNELLVGLAASEPEQEQREDKPNPFDVLAQLKPGNKKH